MDRTLVIAVLLTVLGGVVAGLAGFGFAVVAVPPLLLAYDPPTVVAAVLLLSLLTGLVVLPGALAAVDWRTAGLLLPWAILGMLGGAAVLQRLRPAQIELAASLVVMGFAVALAAGWRLPGAATPAATAAAGAFSGLLNTATGMAGPPIALLFAAREYGVARFRTTIVAYFVAIDLIGIAILLWQGVVGPGQLRTALLLMPGAVLGTFGGRLLARRVSVAAYRRVTLGLLIATGLVGLAHALGDLLR